MTKNTATKVKSIKLVTFGKIRLWRAQCLEHYQAKKPAVCLGLGVITLNLSI